MGGTRYHARGIDDEGNVANHTEIEQIVYMNYKHDPPLTYVNSYGEQASISKTAKLFSYV